MGEMSIDDLLQALQNPDKVELENNEDTWSRIGRKDDFSELGLEKGELEDFLTEWIGENDYQNI